MALLEFFVLVFFPAGPFVVLAIADSARYGPSPQTWTLRRGPWRMAEVHGAGGKLADFETAVTS